MKAKIGDKDILWTGAIIGRVGQPIRISVAEDNDRNPVWLRFTFVDQENAAPESPQTIRLNPINLTELEVVLTNFTNSLGSGTTESFNVGKLNDKPIWLDFIVYALAKGTKNLVATISFGGPA